MCVRAIPVLPKVARLNSDPIKRSRLYIYIFPISYRYTVLNLEFYGLDSYPVIGHNKENLQLGLAPSGIKIYKDWKMIALFAWGRVLKVAQKRKRLSLVVKSKLGSDGIEEKAIFFELESKILCEVLYDNLVDYLQFYRMRLNVRWVLIQTYMPT